MPGRRFGHAPKYHATPVFVDDRDTTYTRPQLEAACRAAGIPVVIEARHRQGSPTLRPRTLRELAAVLTLTGQPFASKAEAGRFLTLRQWQREGRIRDLRCQVPFDLHAPGGGKVGVYVCDFQYQTADGQTIVEDCKGMTSLPAFRAKARHVLAEYGVSVVEVRRGRA